jgi:hypothetical protein
VADTAVAPDSASSEDAAPTVDASSEDGN